MQTRGFISDACASFPGLFEHHFGQICQRGGEAKVEEEEAARGDPTLCVTKRDTEEEELREYFGGRHERVCDE